MAKYNSSAKPKGILKNMAKYNFCAKPKGIQKNIAKCNFYAKPKVILEWEKIISIIKQTMLKFDNNGILL